MTYDVLGWFSNIYLLWGWNQATPTNNFHQNRKNFNLGKGWEHCDVNFLDLFAGLILHQYTHTSLIMGPILASRLSPFLRDTNEPGANPEHHKWLVKIGNWRLSVRATVQKVWRYACSQGCWKPRVTESRAWNCWYRSIKRYQVPMDLQTWSKLEVFCTYYMYIYI